MNEVSIEICADAIVKRIRRKLSASGGPVFVPFGEIHHTPVHTAAQILVLEKLRRCGVRVALGTERPCDFSLTVCLSFLSEPALEEFDFKAQYHYCAYELSKQDHVVLSPLFFVGHINSAWGYRLQIAHALHHGIPVRFNDVSVAAREFLKEEAELSAEICVRNQHMAEQAIAHASSCKAQVYLQNCGAGHVIGNARELPYAESLTTCFNRHVSADQIVPVILTSNQFPAENFYPEAGSLHSRDLRPMYFKLSGSDFCCFELQDNLHALYQGKQIIKFLLGHSGIDLSAFEPNSPAHKKNYQYKILHYIQDRQRHPDHIAPPGP